MKKLLIATNILTLIIFYFSSFRAPGPVAAGSQSGSCDPVCTNYSSNPIIGISNGTAKAMASLYRQKQWSTINKSQAFSETKSVWFSLDKLKAFIGEMEGLTSGSGCSTNLDLGVRIYIGAYPNIANLDKLGIKTNTAYRDVKNSYSDHITLFMVPTYHTTDSTQVDFDPRNLGSNRCQPTPLSELLKIKFYNPDNAVGKMDPKLYKTLQRSGFNPDEIIETTPAPLLKNKAVAATSASTPPTNKALILSGTELQTFFSVKTKMLGVTQAINHGNTIPPDAAAGTAF